MGKNQKKVWIRRISLLLALWLLGISLPYASGKRLSMSYLYFGSPSAYSSLVERTNGALDEVSPNYFELHADGSLKKSGSIDSEFIRQMHQQNIRVVPFLSNHWDRASAEAALARAPALAAELASAVREYQLDGVHVNLENLTHEHREAYTMFVECLRRELAADHTVAVAVAANPDGYTKGWHGSYDYAALAEVADYLMIMTYDEHYEGSDEGPVASLDFAKRSIAYALRYVQPDKLVLGIPFYGRLWHADGLITGQGIGDDALLRLLQTYGGIATYDAQDQSAVADFTIPPANQFPEYFGNSLPDGAYTAWYADERAKKELLGLVETYDLKGAGSWSLGQETAGTWDYYSLWLNGLPFADAQGHWAVPEIIEVCHAGLMKGISETAFAPDRAVTRAEAAVILTRLLNLPVSGEPAEVFWDLDGHWAEKEIAAMAGQGLLEGMGDGRFEPDTAITREQAALLLHRCAARLDMDAAALMAKTFQFSDAGHVSGYAAQAVSWAAANGLLLGSGGLLRPMDEVTRAQMAALLLRFEKIRKGW